MSYERELNVAKELAVEAGKIMMQYFRSQSDGKEWKDDNTPLTIADTEINSMVIERIEREFPDHDIIGEEESRRKDSDYAWVCDPIDGTTPFSHGIPNATFNLALVKDGKSVMSVVLDPFCDRLYHAVKGEGAFLNDTRLEVDHESDAGERVPINMEMWAGFNGTSLFSNPEVNAQLRSALSDNAYVPLTFCSVAYSVVNAAEGGLKGILFGGTNPWDAAACTLVASEAGLVVTNMFGYELSRMDKATTGFIIGTKDVHKNLSKRFKPIIDAAEKRE